MKRFLTLLTAVILSFSTIFAQDVNDTIQVIYADEVETGIIGFVWQGGEVSSAAYYVSIGKYNEATNTASLFAGIASVAPSFAISGMDGYFQCSSDIVLEYGDNYTSISASANVVAEWEAKWNECVNESDFTLKPGIYAIYIEGIDLTFATTEVETCILVEVAENNQGIEEIKMYHNSGKFIDNAGNLYILKSGNVYNIQGQRLK